MFSYCSLKNVFEIKNTLLQINHRIGFFNLLSSSTLTVTFLDVRSGFVFAKVKIPKTSSLCKYWMCSHLKFRRNVIRVFPILVLYLAELDELD